MAKKKIVKKERILEIIGSFKSKKLLVVGDVMLDKYVWGRVSRISPEAPVPVVSVEKESYAPGGSANVASNIASLGGKAILAGIVGNDDSKRTLMKELEKRGIDTSGIITDKKRPTVRKVRIIGQSQQLVRVDFESKEYISQEDEKRLIDYINRKIDDVDAVVFSDYAKGVATKKVLRSLVKLCSSKNVPLIIDPKPRHAKLYRGATLITPNHKEACQMAGVEEVNNEELSRVGAKLTKSLNAAILITRGERGMSLFEKGKSVLHIPTKAIEVYDVTGAGDTVAGVVALALAAGASFEEAAIIANHAAGVTVGKVGTSTVSTEELIESLEKF